MGNQCPKCLDIVSADQEKKNQQVMSIENCDGSRKLIYKRRVSIFGEQGRNDINVNDDDNPLRNPVVRPNRQSELSGLIKKHTSSTLIDGWVDQHQNSNLNINQQSNLRSNTKEQIIQNKYQSVTPRTNLSNATSQKDISTERSEEQKKKQFLLYIANVNILESRK